jgi:hypothetical protein
MPRKKAKPKTKPVSLPGRPKSTTKFQPGNALAAGRGPNKITMDLKQGIVGAASELGYDGKGLGGLQGYLKFLAEDYPKQFTSLLGRVIPLQITATPGMFIGQVNIVGVPPDRYMSAEQIRALQPPDEPPIIDGQQVFEPPHEGEDEAA